jgi:hypothetical protein
MTYLNSKSVHVHHEQNDASACWVFNCNRPMTDHHKHNSSTQCTREILKPGNSALQVLYRKNM